MCVCVTHIVLHTHTHMLHIYSVTHTHVAHIVLHAHTHMLHIYSATQTHICYIYIVLHTHHIHIYNILTQTSENVLLRTVMDPEAR